MTILDILADVFTAGIPLFLLTYVLVCWSLHRGWLAGATVGEIQGSIDALGKAQKSKKSRQKIDPASGKWFRFGGGFYGLVALYTWLLIEWNDIADFLSGLSSLAFNLNLSALISLLIEVFVESVVNFVVAVSWPAYWLTESRGSLQLFLVAYAGYWLGIKAAQYSWDRGWVSSALGRAASLVKRDNLSGN